MIIGAVAFLLCMWAALRMRILPVVVMRGWFGLTICIFLVLANIGTFFIDALRHAGVARETTGNWCMMFCHVMFYQVFFLNPHIQIRIDESKMQWANVPDHTVMAMNHVSFIDPFFFAAYSPMHYARNCRALVKASLSKVPIFGPLPERIGHFPVHFKTENIDEFSVHKDLQAQTMGGAHEHAKRGGRIAMFPEGGVNRQPKTLLTFRHGIFKLLMEHKMPLYYMVATGFEKVWPPGVALGGFPADVDIIIGAFPINFEKEEAVGVSERLRAKMQDVLDRMYASQEKAKKKPHVNKHKK